MLKDDAEHAAALAEAEALMRSDPQRDTPEGQRLSELADAIEAYEEKRWPFPEPTPEERAEFRRDQER